MSCDFKKNSTPSPWKRQKTTSSAIFRATGAWGLSFLFDLKAFREPLSHYKSVFDFFYGTYNKEEKIKNHYCNLACVGMPFVEMLGGANQHFEKYIDCIPDCFQVKSQEYELEIVILRFSSLGRTSVVFSSKEFSIFWNGHGQYAWPWWRLHFRISGKI